ncbi:DUF302 domain-containing protein [Jannaschia sp. Os4]|uniref:DUF302 domain-containing protein n=1 Tax=Jannaschia sp. Os4 TaxID=2807617 RepID=UPI001939DCBE|nr:DUF302 domain-containing protein [Jannaschia sp. Os4]MBM2576310.1 DUF302 domain-containing protein [Jannaschia sp. Os4]
MRHAFLALALLAAPAAADEIVTIPFDGTADDADFVVASAIEAEGLVIDYVSNVGEMMERTGADLGLGPSPVGAGARSYLFCSATVSRAVMEADPMNMAHCPYAIFVAEIGGETVVGHKRYADQSMAPVNDLLARIAAGAAE